MFNQNYGRESKNDLDELFENYRNVPYNQQSFDNQSYDSSGGKLQ